MHTIAKTLSRITAALLLAATALVPSLIAAPSAGATAPSPGTTTTLTIGAPALTWARGIAADRFGHVWIASLYNSQIIRVETSVGGVMHYDISAYGSDPYSVTVASDDTVWVGTNTIPGTLIHLSNSGTVLGSYPSGDVTLGGFRSLTETSDGMIWFASTATNKVGYFDPSLETFTGFGSGTTDSATTGLFWPTSITEGPDGNLWVANFGTPPTYGKSVSKIVRTSSSSVTVTTYDGSAYLDGPVGIVDGGDGNLYIGNQNNSGSNGSITKITTSGVFTDYPDVSLSGLAAITTATDNKVWALSSNALTSFNTTSHAFSAYVLSGGTSATSIAQAADGALWYPEHNTSEVRSTGIGIPSMPETPLVYSDSGSAVTAVVDTSSTYDGGSPILSWTLVASDGRDCTTTLPASPCTITGLTQGTAYTFTLYYQNANGTSFASYSSQEFIAGGSGFTALASPVRVFDTRTGVGTTATPMSAGGHRGLVVTGSNGVPVSASAVVLNLTATGASVTSNGWAAVVPHAASFTTPTVSNLNFVAGRAYSVAVTVPVGTAGSIDFFNKNGTVNLIADLLGYYDESSGSTLVSMNPSRVFDSRTGVGTTTGAFSAGEHRDFNVVSAAALPGTATSVVFNVTATGASDPNNGWVAVTPTPAGAYTTPTTSNLNFTSTSGAIANMVICGIGSGGKVSFFNKNGNTQIIADLVGYYVSDATGARYFPVTPTRAFDTRNGTGGVPVAPIGAGATLSVTMRGGATSVPASSNVEAVLLNLTATTGSTTSWFDVVPGGVTAGSTSSLNFLAGKAAANLVLGRLGVSGTIGVYNKNGTANAIGDVQGYFAGVPLAP